MALSNEEKQALLRGYTNEILTGETKAKKVKPESSVRDDDLAATLDAGEGITRLPQVKGIPPSTRPPESQVIGDRDDYDLNKQEFAKRRRR